MQSLPHNRKDAAFLGPEAAVLAAVDVPELPEIVLAPGASIPTLTSSEIQGEGCLVGA